MKKFFGIILSFFAPVLAFAQTNVGPVYQGQQTGISILITILSIMNVVIKVLVAFAILMIIWGVIQFIISGTKGDEEARKKATGTIMYGVLGLFVITAMWGLVAVLKNTFGVSGGTAAIPCVPGQNIPNCQ